MISRLFLLLTSLMALSACSGTSAGEYQQQVGRLSSQAAILEEELSAIDSAEAVRLYETSGSVLEQFRTIAGRDTLELEFARKLESYVTANKDLEHLPSELVNCKTALAAAEIRLAELKKDIRQGNGERTKYATWVTAESAEMKAIGNHCSDLKRRFSASESAIAQFQPEIERFISRFVQPVKVP